jgi:hypothetical protein
MSLSGCTVTTGKLSSYKPLYTYKRYKMFMYSHDKCISAHCSRSLSGHKLSLYWPWRPLGLREVEAPTFSDIRLIDGGKVASPTRWPLFNTQKNS